MKQFFKFFFASFTSSLLVVVISMLLFVVIVIGGISGAIQGAVGEVDTTEDTKIESNSVLHLTLNHEITERGNEENIPFNINGAGFESGTGLNDIVSSIRKAKDDDRIEGIYLDLSFISTGISSVKEIRETLEDFKASGKWIISYAKYYTQKTYYLASVADEVYLYPEGIMELKGLGAKVMFLTGFLEKWGIEMQAIRGKNNKFKSAVEPFTEKKMSEANRQQTQKLIDGLWEHVVLTIANERNVSGERINEIADNILIRKAQDAVDFKFVDGLKYPDEVESILQQKLDIEPTDEIEWVKIGKYKNARSKKQKKKNKKNKIAVVYAFGDVVMGEGSDGVIGGETISQAIKEAREDSSVKAIVLRINSGGGSALASDIIWRETALTKGVKPLVVSMGDVAASGGYYIACEADRIFAHESTITGSIGVFGMLPNMKKFWNNELAITFEGTKTNENSDFADTDRPLSKFEYEVIQEEIEDIYADFIGKVAKGRGMTIEQVDEIGQGRVWSGVQAIEIGLIDEFGGLDAAVDAARDLAELEEDDFKIQNFPKQKDAFEQILEDIGMSKTELSNQLITEFFGGDTELYERYKYLSSVKDWDRIQTRIPFVIVE